MKKAFTLVELIVVITILAILGTIAFTMYTWYTKDAKNSKIRYDMGQIHSIIWIEMSKWVTLQQLLKNDRKPYNWIDESKTVASWAYIISNTLYKVWNINFKILKQKPENFYYEINWQKKEYILAFLALSNKVYYNLGWELTNDAWRHIYISYWTYFPLNNTTDARGLISESGASLWLQNWDLMTNWLY